MEFDFCDAHFHLIPFLESVGGNTQEFFLRNSSGNTQEFFGENSDGNKTNFFQENADRNMAEFFEKNAGVFFPPKQNHFFCTCAHSAKEFARQEQFLNADVVCRENVARSFGIHPQNPVLENTDFLEGLLRERKVGVVGETGFDFFSDSFKENAAAQEEAWNIQLQLAQEYDAAVVVHARRAMHKIFEYAPKLKKVRSVVFHSFAGSAAEARSILRRGVNAYFSFGKPILNEAKRAVSCVKSVPLENLLFETDAPFQTLRWEVATPPSDIARVYQCAFERRNLAFRKRGTDVSFAEFCAQIRRNFSAAFGIRL